MYVRWRRSDEDKLHLGIVLLSVCITLLREDKLHLGIKNEPVHFVLHSVCITLLREDKLHLGIKNEWNSFCSALGLHYLC